jgi:hypothetical protein
VAGNESQRRLTIRIQGGNGLVIESQQFRCQRRPALTPVWTTFTKGLRVPERLKNRQQRIELLLADEQPHRIAARRSRRR